MENNIIVIDKYNKKYNFNNTNDLLDYGEKSGSPIFMRLDSNESFDIIVFHLLKLENCVIIINDKEVTLYLSDRVDSDKINFIREIINNTFGCLIIKYGFDINLGIITCREIISDVNNRITALDSLLK